MINLLEMSAAGISRAIKDRDVEVAEVVEVHIQRIEAVNPAINAVVTPMFGQAGSRRRRPMSTLRPMEQAICLRSSACP